MIGKRRGPDTRGVGSRKEAPVRLVAVVALAALVAACGCARDDELAEAAYFAEWGAVTARVWIPVNEPRSIGTYRAEVTWPDGTVDRIGGERDGMIAGVWLADLENDGAPDLVVALTSAGSGSYGSVHVYRHRGSAFISIPVSDLSDAQKVGYMGHDAFSVEGGRLDREFPRYLEGDPNASPSGGRVRLRYSFADSAWMAVAGPDD
jgi:hypothetical protein